MAITITPEILGQVADQTCSYCYLYEPLKVAILESSPSGEKLYIDLKIYDTSDVNNIIETIEQYAIYDINPGNPVSVDLMKLARQYHNANVYQYSTIDDVIDTEKGWKSVVSEYKYRFYIYSDETETPVTIFKLPIIGGRTFPDFVPAVGTNQVLTETSLNEIDMDGRWIDYPVITSELVNPMLPDSRPVITSTIQSTGCKSDGYLIWKSRFGGWCTWGMDIKVDNHTGTYSGDLDSGYFTSTDPTGGGNPYIPVNYTGVESSYGYSLKALSLLTTELKGISGIHFSPAIYFMKDNNSMELMKKQGVSTPISSLSNGGDFSITLKNISSMTQKTR
jgi:hypothetical protein